jgi:TM2 domain-containing membrane protein YozV
MKIHIKAALLSAFVLPGLGQLYKGDRLKGVILIVLVNIFLLAAVFLILQGLGPLIISAKETGVYDPNEILAQLHSRTPAVELLLTAFSGLWLYSWLDAALRKKRSDDH